MAKKHLTCSGNKSQQAQKQPFAIEYQKLLIFLRILLFPFHCIQFEKNALSTTKKPSKKKFHPSWGYFRMSRKNIYNFLKIMQHITSWTLILMFTYQTVNLFSSNKRFIYFTSNYIWWNQHETVYTTLVKVDILVACGTMIYSYFGITFLIFFNAVYTSYQNFQMNISSWSIAQKRM